jgi:hypothetical protein
MRAIVSSSSRIFSFRIRLQTIWAAYAAFEEKVKVQQWPILLCFIGNEIERPFI